MWGGGRGVRGVKGGVLGVTFLLQNTSIFFYKLLSKWLTIILHKTSIFAIKLFDVKLTSLVPRLSWG